MQIYYRKCEKEDLNFILELKEKCFKWYIEKIDTWDLKEQINLTKKELNENIKYMKIIVDKETNEDIGLITKRIDNSDDLLIGMFPILPKFQNMGLGGMILKEIISENKERRIHLKTYKENPSKKLYERLGFNIYGQTSIHWLMEIR